MTLTKIIALAVLALAFASCREYDTVAPPTDGNKLLPSVTGTYWIYNNYDIAADGTVSTEIKSTDSVVIEGNETKDGKEAAKHTTYENGTLYGSNYWAADSKAIYTYSNFINNAILSPEAGLPIPVTLPAMWLKVGDESATTWDIHTLELDTTITLPVEGFGNADVSNIKLKLSGKNNGMTNINVNGVDYAVREYEMGIALTATALSTAPVTGTTSYKLYFAENKGLVKSVFSPLKIVADGGILGKFDVYEIGGTSKNVIRMNIEAKAN